MSGGSLGGSVGRSTGVGVGVGAALSNARAMAACASGVDRASRSRSAALISHGATARQSRSTANSLGWARHQSSPGYTCASATTAAHRTQATTAATAR